MRFSNNIALRMNTIIVAVANRTYKLYYYIILLSIIQFCRFIQCHFDWGEL